MIQPIILAGGKGTRMKSELPKTLTPVGGVPIIRRIVGAFAQIEALPKPLVVVSHGASTVREYLGEECSYVEQPELTGTGSAVAAALPVLELNTEAVFIVYGDHPFIRPESIEKMCDEFKKSGAALVLGTVQLPDFEDWRSVFVHFGRVLRDTHGTVVKILEYKNATEEQRAITEVNPGVYCIHTAWLRTALPRIKQNPGNGEYYLTDIVELASHDKERIVTIDLVPEEAVGINSPEDAARAELLARVVS